MTQHTSLPWRVFKTPDGRKLVGIGGQDGEGILDAGFGVWAWNDPEGIANAELVVRATNSHEALVKALERADDAIGAILQWTSNWNVPFEAEDEWLGDKQIAKDVRKEIAAALATVRSDCGGAS